MADVLERLKEFGYNAEPAQDPKQQDAERVSTLDRLVRMGYGVKPLPEQLTEEELYQQQLDEELRKRSGGMMDYLPGPVKDVASAAAGYASDMAGVGLRGSAAAENLVRGLIPDKLEGAAGFALKAALPGVGHAVTAMGSEEMSRKKLDLANNLQRTSELFDQEVNKARGDGTIGWARRMGSGALRSGANMLTGSLAGGVPGALALAGATEASQKYGELEMAGKSEAEQLGWATAAGVWESTIGFLINKVLPGNEKLISDALKGEMKKLWKMPLKEAAKEVYKEQRNAQIDEQITELGHLGMRYADGTTQYVSPEETMKEILRTMRDTAAQTFALTGGVQTTSQLGARAAEKRDGATPFGPGQTPPTPPTTPPAAPVTPQTPPARPTAPTTPPTKTKLGRLEEIISKGWVTTEEGTELGLTPEQMTKRETRRAAVEDLIKQEKAVPAARTLDGSVDKELDPLVKELESVQEQLRDIDTKGTSFEEVDNLARRESNLEKKIASINAERAQRLGKKPTPTPDAQPASQPPRQPTVNAPVTQGKGQPTGVEVGKKYEYHTRTRKGYDVKAADLFRQDGKPFREAMTEAQRRHTDASVEARREGLSTDAMRERVGTQTYDIGGYRFEVGYDYLDPVSKTGGRSGTILTVEKLSPDLLEKAKEEAVPVEAPAPVVEEAPAKVKEPWEMPQKEWADQVTRNTAEGFTGSQPTPQQNAEANRLSYGAESSLPSQIITHKDVIRKALSEGKPVPAEVLAEYPDLKPTPVPAAPEPTIQSTDQTDIARAVAEAMAQEDAAEEAAVPVKKARSARKPSKEAEALADRAAKGEVVERPADVSEARWKAMVAQKAKRIGKAAPKTEKPAATPKKRPVKNVAEAVKRVAAQGEQEVRGTVTEAPKLTKAQEKSIDRILQARTQIATRKVDKKKFENALATIRTHAAKLGIEVPSVGTYFYADTYKNAANAVEMEIAKRWGSHPTEATRQKRDAAIQQMEKKPARKPSAETKQAQAEKTQAGKDLLREARKLKSFLPGAVNPELALAAVKYLKAAVKLEYFRFKDFVKYVISQSSKERALELDEYLQAAWKQKGAKDPRLDKPSSVQALLRKKAKPAPKAAPAPKSNWQDSVLSTLSGKTKVDQAVTLPELWAQIEKANPGLTMEEFKQGLLKLHEAGKIKLEDQTGEWDTIINNPLAIRGKDFDEKGGYGLKWFVRGVAPVESPVKNPEPPPRKEVPAKIGGTVGTKNVKTDELREKAELPPRVMPETETVKDMDAEAARIMKADPKRAGRLAEELVSKPRAVTEIEDFILKRHINDLKNRRNAGEDVIDELLTAIEASETVGTIWGRMGVARQVEMNADFSLEGLIRKHFKTVGDKPSKEMLDKLTELSDRIAAKDKEIEELRVLSSQERIDALIEAALKNAQKPAPKEKIGTRKERIRKQIVEGVASFKQSWAEAVKAAGSAFTSSGFALNPEALAALGRAAKAAAGLIKSYAELGVESFIELTARIKQDIGDLTSEQSKIFREEWDKQFAKVESPMGPTPTDPVIGATARELTRYAVEAGITDREEVIDVVHAQLQAWGVDQARSETMRAMSGYGDFRELPTDIVSTTVRGIKGEIQQLLKLEAMQAGQAPEKTGVERREPTETERQLIKDVNDAKKNGGYTVTDPKRQLKSALDTAKTTVENALTDTDLAIAALEKAIADQVPLAKPEGRTPGPTDAKLEDMKAKLAEKRAQRKALRAEYDTIFPPKRGAMSDANRLKMAERLLTRLNDQLEADIAAGNIMGKEPGAPLTSPVLEQQRARREELKAALKAAREGSPEYQAQLQAKEDGRYLKDLQRQEAFWTKRAEDAKAGILPTPKPKKTRTNTQIVDKIRERDKAKRAALAEIEAEKRRRWDLGQKSYAGLSEVATALPRELMAGLENSVVLRQGWFFTMQAPFHPIVVFTRILDGLQSIFSERIAVASQENLKQRANASEYEQAGIEMTQEFGPMSKGDELYQSRIVDWLASTENILWFPARWAAKAYIGTARGFRTFSNGMKADLYDILKHDTMQARRFFNKYGMAKVPEWTESDTKLTGRSANIFAGRGTGLKEGGILNYLLWAPKWAWSRIQAEFLLPLQMASPQFLSRWNSDPAIRIAHARLYAQAAVGAATHLAALYFTLALLAGDDDEKPEMDLDITSTDFLKVRRGDTRIDVMGGLSQYMVFFSRMALGVKKAISGEVIPLRGEGSNPYKGDMWEEMTKQVRYKLGPTASGIVDFITQKTAVGEQLPDNPLKRAGAIVGRRLVPMTWPDIFQAEKSLGLKQGTVAAIEAFMGASVNTYGDYTKYRDGTEEEQKDQFDKALEKMTWDSPDLPYMDLLTEDQVKQVAKRKEERRYTLVFDAMADSPDTQVAEAAKKNKVAYKDAESLQKAQDAFAKDQVSFAALKAQVSLDEAERLLAVRYAAEKGVGPIQTDSGEWLPTGSAKANAAFKERRARLRKAYGK